MLGGALYVSQAFANVYVNGSLFSSNVAPRGGAVASEANLNFVMSNSSLFNNTATANEVRGP